MNKLLVVGKLKAAAWHAVASIIVLSLVVLWVFFVWFPAPFHDMLEGDSLFLLVVAVDFCLGPLISLVIYNHNKPKRELVKDYTMVSILQVCALAYGLYTVAVSRPAYIVFVKDRLDVTIAADFDQSRLSNAILPQYTVLPFFGPHEICYNRPGSPSKVTELLFSGYDVQHLPKYFRPCEDGELVEKAYPLENLLVIIDAKLQQGSNRESHLKIVKKQLVDLEGGVVWLPVVHRFGAWVGLIDKKTGNILHYIDVDPY
jgi:hypothetical protein